MKGNFIRTNILPSKNESEQPEKFLVQNYAKNCKFLGFFFKIRVGKHFPLDDFYLIYPQPTQNCQKT